MPSACTIVTERLPDGRFRATCHLLPDAEAVAETAEAARTALESALDRHFRDRDLAGANPIDAVFRKLRAAGRKAFMPFVTAGDPDLDTTGRLLRRLAESGASLIEVGFPYSDPIADGPVIQASYTRALEKGLQLDQIFEWAKQAAPTVPVPLVAMVSYSLVHRRGPEQFLRQAQGAGFAGAIVPDLPVDEAEALAQLAAARDFKLSQLVTPTTPPDRAARIVRQSAGFVYCVSVAGITGERDRLPEQLHDQLRRLRQETDLPLCVGFGVSKPEHVRMLRDHVDGVIVGSAIVRRLENVTRESADRAIAEVGELVRTLSNTLNEV